MVLLDTALAGNNVVFPISDIDEQNEYSCKLTNYFDWSDPEYYSISSLEFIGWNKYLKYLDDSIAKIKTFRNTLSKSYDLSDINKVDNFVAGIINIYGCFYSLCKNKNSTDIELFLHMMNMINKNIDKVKTDNCSLIKELNESCPALCELLKQLLNDINFPDSIDAYTRECIYKVWNYPSSD